MVAYNHGNRYGGNFGANEGLVMELSKNHGADSRSRWAFSLVGDDGEDVGAGEVWAPSKVEALSRVRMLRFDRLELIEDDREVAS